MTPDTQHPTRTHRPRILRGVGILAAALALALGFAVAGLGPGRVPPVDAQTGTTETEPRTFTCTGAIEDFVVPDGVTHLEFIVRSSSYVLGLGSRAGIPHVVFGTVAVTRGSWVYVWVGCDSGWGRNAGWSSVQVKDAGVDISAGPDGDISVRGPVTDVSSYPSHYLGDGWVKVSFISGPTPAATPTATPTPAPPLLTPYMTSPLYRLYQHGTGDHFYTTNASERDAAIANLGYVSEGVACYISPTLIGKLGVYMVHLTRMYNRYIHDHLLTTSEVESDAITRPGYYNYDGTAGFVAPTAQPGLVPFYRLYHAGLDNHFATTSTAERDAAVRGGWLFEGIIGYVAPATP